MFGFPNIIIHFHSGLTQLPKKIVVVVAPLVGETTNTITLTSLHLHHTYSLFFFPPSFTSRKMAAPAPRHCGPMRITRDPLCSPSSPAYQKAKKLIASDVQSSSPPLESGVADHCWKKKKRFWQRWMGEKAYGLV